ncbi:MAG: malonate transporter subunit MadM [Candidatus Bipolaricaulota bacterium]
MDTFQVALEGFLANDLIVAIALIALIMVITKKAAKLLGEERIASALALIVGLILAYLGGILTGGENGLADIRFFNGAGIGLLGSGMLRDYTIVSTAFEAKLEKLREAGTAGFLSLLIGVPFSLTMGAIIARISGFTDPAEITTIGAGAVTFLVGPVTGSALGVSSEIIALSIATGVAKTLTTIVVTPFLAPYIGLDNPTSAMVMGGVVGTTSGTVAGLAATEKDLVPYGALTATFATGLGTLIAPSVGFVVIRAIFA